MKQRRSSLGCSSGRAGEEIVIAKNGRPVARICPLAPLEPRRPGLLKGPVNDSLLDPLPEDELKAWES